MRQRGEKRGEMRHELTSERLPRLSQGFTHGRDCKYHRKRVSRHSRPTLDGSNAMAALPEHVKAHIVRALACFDTPQQVALSVKDTFGLTVTRQQVETYDPHKAIAKGLAKRWRAAFEEARAEFLRQIDRIAIAHRAVRLRALDRLARKAEATGNIAQTAQLLEQAAKESGDAYTNKYRHEHTGKDGGPIETKRLDLGELTDEHLNILEQLGEALAGGMASGFTPSKL